VWAHATGSLALDRPLIMAIVNVTPDSFSDGGRFDTAAAAIAWALDCLDKGADVVDVGGESTRPQGARPVTIEEELDRTIPVIRGIRAARPEAVVSIDTTKSDVARAALDAGASIVNDVSAFRLDDRMADVCAAAGAGVVLMHSRGDVADMATFAHARYAADVMDAVIAELRPRVEAARARGIAASRIVLDPGIGFAKRMEHSLAVLHDLSRMQSLGLPVLVGASRKRFVGTITGVERAADRVFGTVGANVAALDRGARVFRVHDVRANREALDVAWAVATANAADREPLVV
jgi:dihydropteroate synthase